MQIMASPFTGLQITFIVAVALLCAVLFGGNALLLYLFFRKRKKREMCNAVLQARRESLLEELYALRSGKFDAKEDSEEDDVSEDAEEVAVDTFERTAKVLAVKDMTSLMKRKMGFEGEQYARKCYYVRNSYGFEAKLRGGSDESKERYIEIANALRKYQGINAKRGFRSERVYSGRNTLAQIFFRGKTVCVALALDPSVYEGTKYKGENVGEIKRFESTPLLLRITSARRLEYAKQLILDLAEKFGLEVGIDVYSGRYDLAPLTYGRLYAAGLLKIKVLGEAPDLAEDMYDDDESDDADVAADDTKSRAKVWRVADMSVYMRQRLGLVGAEYDDKMYYVRFGYSFVAKLRNASDEAKERFVSFADEVFLYKGINMSVGFRGLRLSVGNKTVGNVVFRGKTLAVALALDPAVYSDTKYKGTDVGHIKRFEQTPLLLKLTSPRRLGYAKYLLNRLAEEKSLEMGEPEPHEYDLKSMTVDELYADNLLKITVLGEVPADEEE